MTALTLRGSDGEAHAMRAKIDEQDPFLMENYIAQSHVLMQVCVHVCMYVYMCRRMYVCVHIYIYIYIYISYI